jgi:hypothetical protein
MKNTLQYYPIGIKTVYYVMRSKNEVLCAEAGSLAAERSEHIKLFLL